MRRLFFLICIFCFCPRVQAQRLVLPGDHPDPSVVKIGDMYWASSTTSNWMPAFPLLQSKDLIHWKLSGHVFDTLPSWADYYFWAPEISYDGGKVYVYYSAHKKGGNLCIGVASADKPEGPYKDHGPLVCQADGSIDAFPIRDEDGKLCLVWKEDGNSVGRPTPIWMQQVNEGRTAMMGEKKELFRNNAPWEGALVEGVSITRHNGYYYAFYAASACCGTGCSYNTGVARARKLDGPWEKYAKNPVLKNEGEWKCPGHGTTIEKDGRFYFLFHAYNAQGSVFTGREGLLQEFRFTADGWIEFVSDEKNTKPIQKERSDCFDTKKLSKEWEWSVFQNVQKKISNGKLVLSAMPGGGAFIGQKTTSPDYTAEVEVDRLASNASAGLALVGDEKNMLVVLLKETRIQLVQRKDGKETVLLSQSIPRGKKNYLGLKVRNGKDVQFFYGDRTKKTVILNTATLNGVYLPPWDRGLRVALMAKGEKNTVAVFDNFKIREETEGLQTAQR